VERKVVEQRLQRAHTDGQLNLAELDTRLVAVWQAKTRGDLAALTMDLPPVPVQPPVQAQVQGRVEPMAGAPRRKRNGGRTALRVLTTIWASISALNFAVWLLVSITDFHVQYPWFIWVAGPSGVVLGVIWLSVNSGREHGAR
jgi:anti-sigma-K factor RskA